MLCLLCYHACNLGPDHDDFDNGDDDDNKFDDSVDGDDDFDDFDDDNDNLMILLMGMIIGARCAVTLAT